MLNHKEIKYLRRLAHPLTPIFQVGKDGVGENLLKQLDDVLEARELIKVRVLRNASTDEITIGRLLAKKLAAELVQVVGHVIVLFRASKKKPCIDLHSA